MLRAMADDAHGTWGFGKIAAVVLVAGSLGWLIASETVLKPEHELLYSRLSVRSHCYEVKKRERCAGEAKFSVANNGKVAQDDVRIEWKHGPGRWYPTWYVSELVGSTKKRAQPKLHVNGVADGVDLAIRELDPNVVIDFEFHCNFCTRDDLRLADAGEFSVAGSGAKEADPRMTMFGRFFVNIGRMIGVLLP